MQGLQICKTRSVFTENMIAFLFIFTCILIPFIERTTFNIQYLPDSQKVTQRFRDEAPTMKDIK